LLESKPLGYSQDSVHSSCPRWLGSTIACLIAPVLLAGLEAHRHCILMADDADEIRRSLDSQRFIVFYCRESLAMRPYLRSGFAKLNIQIFKSSDPTPYLIEAEQGGGR
jgi:hypothetical protein